MGQTHELEDAFCRAHARALAGRSALQEVQRWVAANPAADHSVASLAKRMQLSPRHFARLFRSEVGITPAAWVEAVRITAVRELAVEAAASPGLLGVPRVRDTGGRILERRPVGAREMLPLGSGAIEFAQRGRLGGG